MDESTREERPRVRPGVWAGAGAISLALLAKGKGLLLLLKALPFAKLFITSGSMVLMMGYEAMRYGWMFGVGFVLLILVHELGHAFAIRRAGISAGWPVFIPGFGALITLRGRPQDPEVDAEISYAGPWAGTAAALASAALFLLTRQKIFLALAQAGFFLNLFNLVPFPPLDGAAVAAVVWRKAWLVGAVLLVGLFFLTHAPMLLVIGVMALLGGRFRGGAPLEVQQGAKLKWAARYFGLSAFLATAWYLSARLLGGSDL